MGRAHRRFALQRGRHRRATIVQRRCSSPAVVALRPITEANRGRTILETNGQISFVKKVTQHGSLTAVLSPLPLEMDFGKPDRKDER